MEERTNIDILYEIAIDRLDAQLKRMDGADTKIGFTFGVSNGITAALAAFITSIPHPIPPLVLIFSTLTAVAYPVTLALLFFAYRRYGRWSFNPDIKTLKDICLNPQYHDYPDIVKTWVASECIRSLEWNNRPMTIKIRRAYRAVGAVAAQGLFLAASCIFYLLN